jgi:hypothetical protein
MASKGILEITDILDEYSSDIQEAITESAIKVAKQGANELKTNSPKRIGKYKKGWRVKTTKGQGFVSCVIHNATDYQLTHLLEKPHLKRNGGLTTPKVHIAPVEEKSNKQYEQEVIKIIENGG